MDTQIRPRPQPLPDWDEVAARLKAERLQVDAETFKREYVCTFERHPDDEGDKCK